MVRNRSEHSDLHRLSCHHVHRNPDSKTQLREHLQERNEVNYFDSLHFQYCIHAEDGLRVVRECEELGINSGKSTARAVLH